jgi:hypothetical protein
MSVREKIKDIDSDFFKDLDPNLKIFVSEIRKDLRNEGHVVIAITGYPGCGKSNDTAIIGAMIDHNYDFDKNICFIPNSAQIEKQYMELPMFSFLHIDEASRGLHKHKWHDKVQQKLNELYDVNREGHHLCTALLMPRFQNFAENFRNFMIKYWIHIPIRGLAIFYKRDDDKDCRDPWHIDENYKLKTKRWKNKRVFERSLGESVRVEQYTQCYWFYCKIPCVPKEVWREYQEEKKDSRTRDDDIDTERESHHDRVEREKIDRWKGIKKLDAQGVKTAGQQAVLLGVSEATVRRNWREMKDYETMKGKLEFKE